MDRLRESSAKNILPSTSWEEEQTPAPIEGEEMEKRKQAATSQSKTAPKTPAASEEEKPTSESESETGSGFESETETWNIFPGLGVELGNGGVILVLLETPSGFALFCYDGVKLRLPHAKENIWGDFIEGHLAKSVVWLQEFQIFEDKTSTIHSVTGVDKKLAMMIRKYIEPEQKLAVGELKYKDIIEAKLEISCLFDETVMELMWGLKNCLQYLVPDEKIKLTNKDRLPMSEGMKIVLRGYEFEVEPDMVNEKIVELTGIVYTCDLCVNRHSVFLRAAGEHLKKISDIDSQHWGLAKLATALKIICYPDDGLPGDPRPVFSKDEFRKLVMDGHLYEGKLHKPSCRAIFEHMVSARRLRNKTLRLLDHHVREARNAYETDQALMSSS